MKDLMKKLHSHVFDGAESGGGAASESGATDFGYPDDGTSEPETIYGKAAETSEESQVGTDEVQESEEGNPDEEFEALIKGKYKSQYDARMHGAIENRFKNYDDNQGLLDDYADATALLFAKYGLEPGDVQGLKNAIETDDGIYSAAAEAEGLTTDKFKENLRLKTDAARGRTMMEEFKIQQEKRATFARWDNEATELKEAFPSFDLNRELEVQTFIDTLNRVGNVKDAFYIAHMGEIMNGAIKHASDESQKKTVENFKARAQRPSENGVGGKAAVVRKDDPSKFTDEDLDEVARRAAMGEKIVF